jgi:Spy/CpxP family protein refolding chaperone
MNKSHLNKLAAAGMLLLGTTVFSLPTLSHQDSMSMKGSGGSMGMMGGGRMGMMGGGDHMGMMGNMMGGGGHMGMMNKYKRLRLSDEQKQQMSDIKYNLRKEHWAIMGQMIDQHAALQKAYAGERPDPAAVGAVYGKIFDLKRQMIEARLKSKNSAKDVLSEEQRARMKKMKHKRRGMKQGQGGKMQGQNCQGGMMQGQGGQTN